MTYFDKSGEPIDHDRWLELFPDMEYRRVAETDVGDFWVSTVWLGIDHSIGRMLPQSHPLYDPDPVIFETLVFDDSATGTMRRYHSEEEALAGHAETVAELRAMIDAVNAVSETDDSEHRRS